MNILYYRTMDTCTMNEYSSLQHYIVQRWPYIYLHKLVRKRLCPYKIRLAWLEAQVHWEGLLEMFYCTGCP
jgi:hypothetical protein